MFLPSRFLGASCFCVLCILLTAGLWPFHAPQNDVAWLKDQSGLQFGRYGSIKSSGPLQPGDSKGDGPCSVEIWLQPDVGNGTKTILGFYDIENDVVPLSIHQYRDDLLLRRNILDAKGHIRKDKLEFGNVFYPRKKVFITITSAASGTRVYVDGIQAETNSSFHISSGNIAGQLVVANLPVDNDSWAGQVNGIAFYHSELSPPQIAKRYADWQLDKLPRLTGGEKPFALYLFNERGGAVVQNQTGSSPDLLVPKHYFILHASFLRAPWREFSWRWYYWKDVGINVAGFIPWGMVLSAYFSQVRPIKHPVVATIVAGLAVSLTIEVLQTFLPTRESGCTDLLTNTLGTALGTMICGITAWIRSDWFRAR